MPDPAPNIRPATGGGGSGWLPPGSDREAAERIKSKILTLDELERLMEGCRGQFEERDRTMIATAYGLAMRASEVVGLKWGGIAWGTRVRFWRPKQGRFWSVAPPARTWRALEKWRLRCGPKDEDAFVFLSRSGRGLRADQFSRIVTRAAIQAGLPKNLRGSHLLRHSRCAHLLASGVDLSVIQQVAGHASPAVTTVYVAAEALRMAERANAGVDF